MEEFICGGGAAVAAIAVMHPVDVVKTRLQLQGEAASHSAKAYRGLVPSLLRIARAEGAKGLYGGLGAACALQLTVTGTRFATYGVGKRVLGSDLPPSATFTLALVAALLGGLAGTPFYAIKTRMQAASSNNGLAVGHQHHYSSLGGAVRDVVRKEGVLGLFRGWQVFVPRVMAYGSMQLTTYDTAKRALLLRGFSDSITTHFAASGCAALLAVSAMQPFDFVAARLMNQPLLPDGKGAYYTGPIDCAIKAFRNEGVVAFASGANANYARMVPYTVLVFVFYEQFKTLARWVER